MGDKTYAAGIMFVPGVIKTLFGGHSAHRHKYLKAIDTPHKVGTKNQRNLSAIFYTPPPCRYKEKQRLLGGFGDGVGGDHDELEG